jgi:hypothetical protein
LANRFAESLAHAQLCCQTRTLRFTVVLYEWINKAVRSINEVFIVVAWQSNLNVNVTIAYLAVTHNLNGFFLFAGEVGIVLNLAGNLLNNVVELGTWQ